MRCTREIPTFGPVRLSCTCPKRRRRPSAHASPMFCAARRPPGRASRRRRSCTRARRLAAGRHGCFRKTGRLPLPRLRRIPAGGARAGRAVLGLYPAGTRQSAARVAREHLAGAAHPCRVGGPGGGRAAGWCRGVAAALAEQVRGRGVETMPRVQALEARRLERLLANGSTWKPCAPRSRWLPASASAPSPWAASRRRFEVDRLDRLPGGGYAIIDYKTGAVSPAQWEGDRPDAPQLPLYAATLVTR